MSISFAGKELKKDFQSEKRFQFSYGEASIMLKLWVMRSNPSLPSLPGPLWPGGVVPLDRSLSMGQIKLNCNYSKLNSLK